ncbi:MAG: acyltransferase family protein [Actinomycetota bacterium]
MREPVVRRPSGVRSGFRTDIQGLRAVAVVLVVLGHAGVPGFVGGFIGVDVFFVISGFLITGHLLTALDQTGRIDLPLFYARRARRILPAALAVIVLTIAAAIAFVPPLRLPEILKDAAASALWVPNLRFAIDQTDYLSGSAPSPFQHYWSLGVEEQFYLFWPVLLLVTFVLSRRSRRMVVGVIGIVVVVSFAAVLAVGSISQPVAFFSLPTRAWELAVGGLVAGVVPAGLRLAPGIASRIAVIAGWLGLAAILLGVFAYRADIAYPGVATLAPVLGTAAVIASGSVLGSADGHGWSVDRLLGIRPLQYLGAVSYSLYLVHWPLIVIVHERLGLATPMPVWLGVLLAIGSLPLAAALFAGVESPFRFRSTNSVRSTLVLAAAIPTVIAVALFATVPLVGGLPLRSNRSVASTTISSPPSATDFVPAAVAPKLGDAAADTGLLYASGCQQTLTAPDPLRCTFGDPESDFVMVLFGDSHAARWFTALNEVAKGRGIRLDTYTKSGCRSEETDALWDASANPSCARWRTAVVQRLRAEKPDVIVLTNHLGPTSGGNDRALQADWERAATSMLARLPAESRVVTIADTPQFAASPVDCLSANVENARRCSVPREAAFNTVISAAQRTVAARTGSGFVDLSDYFCGPSSCPPIIGSTLVYSDEHHVTATFSRQLAPVLDAALAPYLPAR